ncbi:MAG TPA: LpxD N-terminal domain-containing protein, partial [Planctomycetaceae bacterium]|nr:LpxD N-terminal domain-containing protein [Planctomycetaceae bacterium]
MSPPTLGALAQRVEGEVQGNAALLIQGVAALAKAGPNEISFAGSDKHLRLLASKRAGACLVGRDQRANRLLQDVKASLVFVDDPQDAVIALAREFRPEPARAAIGISPAAVVSRTAKIGADCNIFPGAFVGENAVIGARCDLFPGVYVGRDCAIGDDCVLHPHAVLYA